MRQRLFKTLGRWAGEKTWWVTLVVVILTVVFGGFAGKLEMSMDMTSLLPSDDPMVEEFNYIFQEFNGASTILVAVEGENLEDMIAFADHISPQIKDLEGWIQASGDDDLKADFERVKGKMAEGKAKQLDHYIERVEARQPMDFLRNHALMLVKSSDLENTVDMFTDPNLVPFLTNLNNSLEKEYIRSKEKISTTQREMNAVRFLDGIESWVDYTGTALTATTYDAATATAAADAIGLGTPYLTSADRSMLLIMVEPTFNLLDLDHLVLVVNAIEKLVKNAAADYNVTAGLAGGMAIGRDEMVAALADSYTITLSALVLILIIFIVTFRMVSSPLLAILNLAIGVTWALGVSWFLVESLNMMTAMMAVVLVGLGIDFSIHIISVFSEFVNKGIPPNKAMEDTLVKVGPGILTGGFTTAAAFLTLMIARSAGFKEFGLVCGVGLIVIMMSTLISLPAFLMLRERYRSWRGKTLKKERDVSYRAVGILSERIYHKWRISGGAAIIVTIILAYMSTKLEMDYNYLNMEPEGLESIELNDKLIEKFNFSPDVTMMTALSLEENYRLTEELRKLPHVSYVESIADYQPVPDEQAARFAAVGAIGRTMKGQTIARTVSQAGWATFQSELQRLEMNVIEMQNMAFMGGQDNVDAKTTRLVGNPDDSTTVGNLTALITKLENTPVSLSRVSTFARDYGAAFKSLVIDMANTEPITEEMLPEMIRSKHISRDHERYLMTIYPKGNVWDIDYLSAFSEELLEVSPSISGTAPMFYFLLEIFGADGRRASLLTLVVVLLFLWADFKSLKLALLAMLPLLIGVIWMVGIMGATGVMITLLNMIAIPLIIGIGIDDGVHVIHRYRIEGVGSIRTVYRSTGKAIIITSLTTMLAFGSLVFATYRGFGSMGIALFIGVGTCLLASIFVLPAVLAMTERKSESK